MMRPAAFVSLPPRPLAALLAIALAGCLPALDDECELPADCPADRTCVGGVCAPRPGAADATPDGARPDGAPPDGAPHDGAPHDQTVGPDTGPDPDGSPDEGEPPCVPDPQSACNGFDDDCDTVIDEADEAAEACPERPGAVAACTGGVACVYACAPGATPVGAMAEGGCARGCALDGAWVELAAGFSKDPSPDQQVTLAAAGARRFVAAYDIAAAPDERLVRSFAFDVDAPADAVEVRLGQTRRAVDDAVLSGLDAVALGDRFAVGAWRRWGVDPHDAVVVMARDGDTPWLRVLNSDWPQDPILLARPAPNPAVLTFVESHIDRAQPPNGELRVDVWPLADPMDAEADLPDPIVGQRPTGPARDAALLLPDGRIALVADVVGPEQGDTRFRLRVEVLSAALVSESVRSIDLGVPVIDRITLADSADGPVALLVLDRLADGGGDLLWFTFGLAGNLIADELSVPWDDPTPADSRVLALPGGVGAIYRAGASIRLALPTRDAGRPELGFAGELPDGQTMVRALDARQTEDGVIEVVALRERGGVGRLVFARYVCH